MDYWNKLASSYNCVSSAIKEAYGNATEGFVGISKEKKKERK
jgi:hypothetical protein